MPLLPILLIAIVLAADAGLSVTADVPAGGVVWPAIVIAWLPPLLVAGAQWVVTAVCLRALRRGRASGPIMTAERAAAFARGLMLVNHAVAVLLCGWLAAVRRMIGDLVLIDEVIAIAPPLAGVLLTWAVQFPVERRLREAVLVRRLDEGRPVHAMPGRARYVWRQAQLNILLLLIPILMILGAAELIRRGAARWVAPEWSDAVGQAGTLGVGAVVFIVAPLLVRALFSTRRIDDGELRDDLMEVCRRHGVKVRELLVWATDGTMINAAVMGLVAPLRYVLMTDALLETMRRDEVRAVMAHEIGHVRRHHMPWMVLCLVALLAAADWALITPLLWIDARWFEVEASIAPWIELALMTGMVGLILLGFGWVSRRFERQADTFAAQHLSGLGRPDGPDDPAPSIAADAVDSLRSALLTICRMHAIDPKRRSWRHGSIEWRIAYLESIVGRPLQGLPIDRVIRRLKLAAVLCVVAAIGLEGYLLVAARGSAPMTPPPDAADAAVESIEGAAAAEVQTP